jgi:glyoxylase-like metal-dependent hydrolase (beta-lactamase superfamily II)
VKLYAYEKEIEVLTSSKKNLVCYLKNTPYENFVLERDIIPLASGENIIEGIKFNLIPTSGHTKGSCLYYFPGDALFVGDTLIGYSIGRSDLPTGSEASLFHSLEIIKKLDIPETLIFYSGHEKNHTFGEQLKNNPYLK